MAITLLTEPKMHFMKYVYIPQSDVDPDRFYTGSNIDLKRRTKEHNEVKPIHTNKYKTWRLRTYFARFRLSAI